MSLAQLASMRAHLDEAPYLALSGRFHSHLTVSVRPEAIDRLRGFCRSERVKLTVVDLEIGGAESRRQRDVMTTQYHRDLASGAVGRIADDLLGLGERLGAAGF